MRYEHFFYFFIFFKFNYSIATPSAHAIEHAYCGGRQDFLARLSPKLVSYNTNRISAKGYRQPSAWTGNRFWMPPRKSHIVI